MRFAAPIAGCVHGKWKLEYHVVWHWLHSDRPRSYIREMIWKKSLHLIFTFYLNSDTSAPELFPVVVLKKKKIPLVDPFTFLLAMNRNRLELSDCGRKIRNDIHTDTYYCKPNSYHDDNSTQQCFTRVFCPQLIGNMRSRRRIDSSSIIAHR